MTSKRICPLCSKYWSDAPFDAPRGFTHQYCPECTTATKEAMLHEVNRRMVFYFKASTTDAPVANINGEFLAKIEKEPHYRELIIPGKYTDMDRLHHYKQLF